MTNPEIIEKWRDEFLVWLKENHSTTAEFIDGELITRPRQRRSVGLVAGVAWQAWKDSRESVEITLPWPVRSIDGLIVKKHIESQGYRVRSEE